MSESTRLRSNENIKRFTLVDSDGDSITDDALGTAKASPPPSSTISGPTLVAISATPVQVLAANTLRKQLIIQNTGTAIAYLNFGASDPTSTTYTVALQPCTVANDASGGSIISDMWKGAVRALGSSSGTVVASELT